MLTLTEGRELLLGRARGFGAEAASARCDAVLGLIGFNGDAHVGQKLGAQKEPALLEPTRRGLAELSTKHLPWVGIMPRNVRSLCPVFFWRFLIFKLTPQLCTGWRRCGCGGTGKNAPNPSIYSFRGDGSSFVLSVGA